MGSNRQTGDGIKWRDRAGSKSARPDPLNHHDALRETMRTSVQNHILFINSHQHNRFGNWTTKDAD